MPQYYWVRPPRDVPTVSVVNRKHRLPGLLYVVLVSLVGGYDRATRRRIADGRFELGARADDLHRTAVCQQRVMTRQQHLLQTQLITGCVNAVEETQANKALGFIERHPVFYAIGQLVDDHFGILGKPFRALRIEPAASTVKRMRKIPVKERHVGDDIGSQQLIDKPVVEIQPASLTGPTPSGSTRGQLIDSR